MQGYLYAGYSFSPGENIYLKLKHKMTHHAFFLFQPDFTMA